MQQIKVDLFMTANADKFPADKLMYIKTHLERLDDEKLILLQASDLKNPSMMLLVSIFVGILGIDRFLLGDIGLGLLKLLTLGCCYVLYIVDWFLIMDKTREQNFDKVMRIL